MRKVIANAIFKVNDSFKGLNVSVSGKKNMDIYLKNSFVSLYSAKQFNPECDTVLIVNYEIESSKKSLFEKNGIKIIKLEEYNFKFPEDFKWSAAFFKLDALNYLTKEYDLICVIDTDTIFVDNCRELWIEGNESILLFDVDYSLVSQKRKITIDIAKLLFDINENIEHLGGEIIVGNSTNIKKLINACNKVYCKILDNIDSISKGFGQEALLSIAIYNENIKIRRANKYCMRYWTRRIYLVDTNYKNIPIWHLPAEKDYGLLKIFNKIKNGKEMPKKTYISKKLFLKRKMNILESLIFHSRILFRKLCNGDKINIKKNKGWIDK